MTRSRQPGFDIFARQPIAELRASLGRSEMAAEADVSGVEPFMEATIAAAMIIAYADGEADLAERHRIIALFRTSPALQGFSVEDVAREITAHTVAFELDRETALKRARTVIVTTDLDNSQFRTMVNVCLAVLDADGVRHPAEENALADLSAMRPWSYR